MHSRGQGSNYLSVGVTLTSCFHREVFKHQMGKVRPPPHTRSTLLKGLVLKGNPVLWGPDRLRVEKRPPLPLRWDIKRCHCRKGSRTDALKHDWVCWVTTWPTDLWSSLENVVASFESSFWPAQDLSVRVTCDNRHFRKWNTLCKLQMHPGRKEKQN